MRSAIRLSILVLFVWSIAPAFAQSGIEGAYRLISSTRTIVATGEVEDTFGKNPLGFIIYGSDHRMMVLMVRSDRPKPTFESMTDAYRIELFNSMAAYSGTYSFDGKTVVHSIDISWNGTLTGSKVVRSVQKEGQKLIYTTSPGPSPTDGKISTSRLVWEKIDDDK
jgi:hypothetical protein